MGSRIFVGNVSYSSSDTRLKEHFERGGYEVVSARIIVDRDTGRSRGFGFVELGDEAQAQRAIEELDGRELDGRMLALREAHDRKPSGSGRPGPDFVSRSRGPRGPRRDFGGPPPSGPGDDPRPPASADGPLGGNGGGRFERRDLGGPPPDPFFDGPPKDEAGRGKRRRPKERGRERRRDRWEDEY